MGWGREEDDGKSAEERGVRRPCGNPEDDDDVNGKILVNFCYQMFEGAKAED